MMPAAPPRRTGDPVGVPLFIAAPAGLVERHLQTHP